MEYFADFPVLRKVAKSLIYKGYYFEVTTKKTMNLIKKVIVLCYHVSKLSLTDHKKDPKKIHFSGLFCVKLTLPYVAISICLMFLKKELSFRLKRGKLLSI